MDFLFNFIYMLGVTMSIVPLSRANHFVDLARDLPSITSLAVSSSATSSLADPLSDEISFSLPLIHQTSVLSPFYNPNVTEVERFRENARVSRERARYLGRARGISRFQIPITHDFVVKYSVGTPPVETYGVPDTGSDLVWLQCEPCQFCYDQTETRFDSRESSTYEVVDCNLSKCSGFKTRLSCDEEDDCAYEVNYVDGSYSRGKIAEEIITVAGQRRTSRIVLLLGCGFDNNMTSGDKYPSVVGLLNVKRSLIGQTRSTAFSFCYDHKNNGSLQMGKESARLLGVPTPLVRNYDGMYLVRLEDIMVNNEGLNMPFYVFEHVIGELGDEMSGVVIDSGTAITQLHPMAFDALFSKISAHMKKKGKRMSMILGLGLHCWENPGGIRDASLPTIRFMFVNLRLNLGPNAWLQVEGHTCLMIHRFPRPFTIIGLYQLRNINVGFDLNNLKLWLNFQSECLP